MDGSLVTWSRLFCERQKSPVYKLKGALMTFCFQHEYVHMHSLSTNHSTSSINRLPLHPSNVAEIFEEDKEQNQFSCSHFQSIQTIFV
jgi:hypothetical protein